MGYTDMVEGGQDMMYGLQGDTESHADNPIKDVVFQGDEDAYNLTENLTLGMSTAGAIIVTYHFASVVGSAGKITKYANAVDQMTDVIDYASDRDWETAQQVVESGSSSEKYYYHVTTKEAAEQIISSEELGRRGNSWESRVFAWTEQPTKKQASIAGIGKEAQTVIRFNTNASFEPDIGNKGKSIADIVVQTTDAQRVPISIKNVEIVRYKEEWWQFWKK